MTPAAALERQIQHYRQMSGEQRLAVALELHEMSCDVAREGIRRQNPRADPAEVERLLRRRLELARAPAAPKAAQAMVCCSPEILKFDSFRL